METSTLLGGTVPNGDRICRVCLQENVELFSIFKETYSSGVTIAHILSECIRYPIIAGDLKLPHHICSCCLDKARAAYDFKQRVEKAYVSLLDQVAENIKCNTKQGISSSRLRDYGTQTDRLSLHPCEMCEMKFFDLLELRQHRKQFHHNSNLQCRICGIRFERIRQLRSHLVHKHPSVGIALDIQCSICRRRFSRREHLNRHLRNVHHQPEAVSIRVSLKEPEIELSSHKTKAHQPAKPKDVEVKILEKEKQEVESNFQLEKNTGAAENEDFLVSSHFLECGQHVHGEIESDVNMITNPISSDEEANDGMELPDDILPQLKLEHEPDIKVKCELDDSTNGFDMAMISPDWERSNSPVNKSAIKQEKSLFIPLGVENLSTPKRNSSSNEEYNDYTERRRITEVVDEFLAIDETANSENRCSKCQRTFSRHCHLRRHMLTHVDEKAHACTYCPKRFARSDHLKKHVMNLHQAKEFKCDHCNSAFARSAELTKHIETRHGSDPQAHKVHDCEYCGKKFTSRTYLRKHILMHTDRVFACKFCEETFKERKALREHEKGHHSDRRNFLCSVCGESFVRNDYLRVHMRRHNGEKPYKCQYCGKGFPRATDVKIHERYHTGTKPNLCTLCGKGFHRAYNLTIHMRTHTGERPFKCEECGRGFAQSNDLKAHIRRHTGERFKCPECDAGFLQMYALRQHAQAVHGIHMEPSTGRLQRFAPLETTVTAGQPLASSNLSHSIGEHAQLLQQHQQLLQAQISSAILMPQPPSSV
ncbi:zinc finger protein 91-like [Rhagoletis pomonella]|uniref:zinc finger protein 91-like n=1 Tax=Rhagoletis pomonella TaxID=28610 RepID=UPI001784BC98|nr:zinc finger protein 91-like [Rhagoletis pomonella]